MPPEARPVRAAMGQDAWRALPEAWRGTLARLALAVAALMFAAAREWGEMAHQWWNIDTYNHVLLVPVIIVWLVRLRLDALAQAEPRAWLPGLSLVAAALALWGAGRITGINLLAHAGAVGAVQGAVIALLGLRVAALLALPLGFAVFLVPFGDEIIPALQLVTADIAVALTRWSGIPAEVESIYIQTPVALFIVAEACSGVKFLAAMVALGVLVSFTRFERWSRRAAFMLAAIIVPILANGVRAWGTIMVAHAYGVEFAEGFDHIVYGWVFFALVVAVLLGAAWPFFEREPEDHGWSPAALDGSGFLARSEGKEARAAFPALLAFAFVAALFGAIAGFGPAG